MSGRASRGPRVSHLPFDPERSYVGAYRRHFFRRHAHLLRGRVLDVGAGGDAGATTFRDLTDGEYVALDRSPAPRLDVIGDGTALPFRDGAFDAVVLSSVLEHVPLSHLPPLLGEVRRVLAPDGHALAFLPFLVPLHNEPHDYSRLTPSALSELFSAVGFSGVEVHRGGGYADVLLATLYRPYRAAVHHLGLGTTAAAFAAVHYPIVVAAALVDRGVRGTDGANAASDPWHLCSFVVASSARRRPSSDGSCRRTERDGV